MASETDRDTGRPAATALPKLMYLIKRRPGTSREELIANWFANHMPDVIASQHRQAERGGMYAHRYIATLYQPDADGNQAWDGVAQLWWSEAPPASPEPHGTEPRDTFQQKAEPYVPWATTEYVVVDGSLPVTPNTLNDPYPFTRSGFVKVTALVAAKPNIDVDAFYAYWLGPHAGNVADAVRAAGGLRYVISLSDDLDEARYAGMAELYFPDHESLARYREIFERDEMDTWVDRDRSETLLSSTEMVGIP